MRRRFITFGRIIQTGVVNFMRNISIAIAAIAVMTVTLTIVLLSVVINSTFANTVNQITSKIDISVYLKDSDTASQVSQLVTELKKLPDVAAVQYLDKAQVLKNYEQENSGNQQLSLAISETSNPLPATIHIKPSKLDDIGDIKSYLAKPSVDALQVHAANYSPDLQQAITNITHATDVLRELGLIAIIVFSFISALIIFNTIQMAIFNRRDEIQIMRLLGASTTYIRGPFVVESAIYGILSAILSIVIINSVFITASSTLQATTLGLLDINYATSYFDSHFWTFLTMQILIGIVIGSVSATVATKRYLKFKIK